jgi:hypothetical protein
MWVELVQMVGLNDNSCGGWSHKQHFLSQRYKQSHDLHYLDVSLDGLGSFLMSFLMSVLMP